MDREAELMFENIIEKSHNIKNAINRDRFEQQYISEDETQIIIQGDRFFNVNNHETVISLSARNLIEELLNTDQMDEKYRSYIALCLMKGRNECSITEQDKITEWANSSLK